ncbi:hypothetical protein RX327_26315 [Bradyrhizobium sp. BEA-2-5]|nr:MULTISPECIES: hypothetical protein [Bradyrhizobium]WOH79377.1 hypothetical protein RX327_26315 [Bradyrhizobium sp. BEA-2-5]
MSSFSGFAIGAGAKEQNRSVANCRAGGDKSASTDDLPKIEGKMLTPKTN